MMIHPKLIKIKFYNIAIKLVKFYGTKCQDVKRQYVHKISGAEIMILRRISGNTK